MSFSTRQLNAVQLECVSENHQSITVRHSFPDKLDTTFEDSLLPFVFLAILLQFHHWNLCLTHFLSLMHHVDLVPLCSIEITALFLLLCATFSAENRPFPQWLLYYAGLLLPESVKSRVTVTPWLPAIHRSVKLNSRRPLRETLCAPRPLFSC